MLEKQQFQQVPERLGLRHKRSPSDENGFYYCPLHEESQPSLSISFSKGIFHCFSCHESGTLNKLCKLTTSKNIYQVLGLDNEFKNLTSNVEPVVYADIVQKEVDESLINIDIRGATIPFQLSNDALYYMKQRGISEETGKKYNFKYADDIYINERKFIKRLLIPIYGETGRMVNIEGRDITRRNNIKVLYPKDSIKPIWNIMNLDPKKPLLITEGLIDLFLLEQAPEFFSNLTVIFGSSISPYQKKMLTRFENITTIFNNDAAGETAYEKLKEELDMKIDRIVFDREFNDIGEIWEFGKMTVSEFHNKGGFYLKRDNSFFI